ncbi:MAG TPA: VWA domain-containing protein [Ruminococcus flavefaciens]|nr:VWA domain-containing protein [Ruminococcus flavefaciens]
MKIKKMVSPILASMLICFSSAALPASAETVEQDGLQVILETDKDEYAEKDSIKVDLSVKNNNPYALKDVTLESVQVSDYVLAEGGYNEISFDSLGAGETVSLEAVYVTATQASTTAAATTTTTTKTTAKTTAKNSSSPKTGDKENILLLWAALGLSVLVCGFMFLKKDDKKAKKMLSLFLAFALLDGFTGFDIPVSKAADLKKSIGIEKTIKLKGSDVVVKGNVSFSTVDISDIPLAVLEGSSSTTDTDGDGLTDYQEYCLTNTDPNKVSTGDDGVKDADRDEDQDGLSNITEIRLGTNPLKADTDNDGLTDKEEQELGTDPLNADTDGDHASDGWEKTHGYDPITPDDSFTVTATESADSVTASVSLEGGASQASNLKVGRSDNMLLDEGIPGYIGPAFNFETEGDIDSATISFEFDEALLADEDFEPVIYYFNEETQLLEELPTTVEGNKASTVVPHFSTYILLNKKDVDKMWEQDIRKPAENSGSNGVSIAFVLDRSKSMDWNDEDNLRNKLTTQFVEKLSEDTDKGSIVSFIADAKVVAKLTNNKAALKNAVDSIVNDSGYNSNSGTNGSAGIYTGIQELKGDASGNSRYIFFMTDGEDNRYSYEYSDLINMANENEITIYTIGLGDVDSSVLEKVANETGGKYYYAPSADELSEGYKKAEQETIDYHTDSNDDGISDYYTKLLCEGKLTTGTGSGINAFKGLSYDDVQANDDYDGDHVKNGDELVISENNGKIYCYVVSDPEEEDTDKDGILDNEDTAPRAKGLADGIIGELTIISCHPNDSGFTGGHAWLSYKSYVKDNIDVSGLANGYIYRYGTHEFIQSKINSYPINVNGNLAIGNAGEGMSEALSTLVGSCGGILYNREYYGAWVNNNFYIDVAAYSRDVTQDQLNAVLDYCAENCYYNLYSHNCSTVASEAWKKAFGSEDGFESMAPPSLWSQLGGISSFISNPEEHFDTPMYLKECILKKADADTDYQSTMLGIIASWK